MTYERGQLIEAIEDVLPYDGPHEPEKVADAASGLYELVRYMNNATFAGRALPHARTVDQVLGGVRSSLYAMDQLFRQLTWALAEGEAGRNLYHDDNRDDPAAGERTAQELQAAIRALQQQVAAAAASADACTALSTHLGNS
ncbi:MAG: hypothetical protein J2P19_00370 [Pseudonocardia sp.]|nr:hypothetical protein [Pseudonocardia sp.]